jgi:hypothetical protein
VLDLYAGAMRRSRIDETPYLRDVHKQHEFFSRHPHKNFYQNIRRDCRDFTADLAEKGKRRLRESF